jgi:membrane fusion protein, multidrug efflux system
VLFTVYELVSGVLVYSRDAYITTDVIGVAPQVSGPLSTLAVKGNQVVQKGDLLIKIDPEPFQLDLDRLQANLELARATEEKAKEEVSIGADRIASQQAQLDDSKVAFKRAADLRKMGNIAQQALDDAQRTFDVATALRRAAQASRVTAEQEVFVQAAAVTAARAAVARAKYNLDCTVLVAPVSGRVAPLIVRVGDYLTAGRPVVAIVSDENWRLVVPSPAGWLRSWPSPYIWTILGGRLFPPG